MAGGPRLRASRGQTAKEGAISSYFLAGKEGGGRLFMDGDEFGERQHPHEPCGVGVVLIDPLLQIVAANRQAEALIAESGPQGLVRLLSRCGPVKAGGLRKTFEDAVIGAERRVILVEPEGAPPLICRVAPGPEHDRTLAQVFLAALWPAEETIAPHLEALYGLSQTEAEIASSIGRGLDAVQIAQGRGVSIDTIRGQIGAIKLKMELSRMSEIAVRVSSIATAAAQL
jgi:DNA-binding CsgD family transcriptional regulator